MPELPEVETARRGIEPHVAQQTVTDVIVRQRQLRWLIPTELEQNLIGQTIQTVKRRAKYILLGTRQGTLLLHLGMSGSLRILPDNTPLKKHDHVDIVFHDHCLRFNDPRRFGALLWTTEPPEQHLLLRQLGPEPLSTDFTAGYLYQQAKKRRMPVKQFIMDGHIVVGVGNIYASEALFLAGIRPTRAAGRIALARYEKLCTTIRQVLQAAIEQGGTTLRDFVGSQGEPGYFKQSLYVYDRAGEPCKKCATSIQIMRLGQRSTYFCPRCQS